MERIEATLMHMAQNLKSQVPQQPQPQKSQPKMHEERRSSHANEEVYRRLEHSPQGTVPTSTKRNEATSGQCAPSSQQTGENPRATCIQRTGENSRAVAKQRTGENLKAARTQRMKENPMAVRTQWTGVNPRAEVARSHTPTSVGTRGHTGSARTGHNKGRSESGNVFKRLGKGANLRDTLNRRRDQERSQHSTSQRRRQKVNSRGQREIPIEDLCHAIVSMEENDEELIAAATGSPFSREIREAKLLEGFKLSTIKAYEGKSNPQDHLDHFNDLMELHFIS